MSSGLPDHWTCAAEHEIYEPPKFDGKNRIVNGLGWRYKRAMMTSIMAEETGRRRAEGATASLAIARQTSERAEAGTAGQARQAGRAGQAGQAGHGGRMGQAGRTDFSRWRSVIERDRRADGQFVYAVRSTGIFCRPSCPSRRPDRSRVEFLRRLATRNVPGFVPASAAGRRTSLSPIPGSRKSAEHVCTWRMSRGILLWQRWRGGLAAARITSRGISNGSSASRHEHLPTPRGCRK